MRSHFFIFAFFLLAPAFLFAQNNQDSIRQLMYQRSLEKQQEARGCRRAPA